MIHVEQLSIEFDQDLPIHKHSILEAVSFHIRPQEAVSIIGPSGSGKSLILKAIAGLLIPNQGTVRVNSNQLSMLFQKNALFDSLTLIENLTTPLAETLGIFGEDAQRIAIDSLDSVGLKHVAHLFPSEISGGMQKRLGIARALIVRPEVILYDEPTAGLDPITSRSIAELILQLHRKNRTTLLMVTNDLERAYQISDRILFCSGKKIVDLGSPKDARGNSDPGISGFLFANAVFNLGVK